MKYLTETKYGGYADVTLNDITSNPKFWRDSLYERKLLVLRGLKNLSEEQYWNLHTIFGLPWKAEDYKTTTEKVKSLDADRCFTLYGNIITKESIGNKHMPWHRDIPWHREKRYPIRTLYPVKMTLGAGNTGTRFCDCDVLWDRISLEERQKVMNTKVQIQSWYQFQYNIKEPERKWIPLVEIHPKTVKASVLLNSFGPQDPTLSFSTALSGTWIRSVKVNDEEVGLNWIDYLHSKVCTPDNIYNHIWEEGDLVLFDNYSGVFHGRDRVVASENAERMFWRMNLRHTWQ